MSSLIPQTFIDDLLNRVDLVDLIDGYVPLKKQGTSFVACCPFHNEKNPSFHVIAQKQFYYCFGCGVSGNAISFVIEYLQRNFVEAVEMLAARLGLEIPRDGKTTKQKPSKSLYQILELVSADYQQKLRTDGKVAVDYLKKRGVSGAIAKQYEIGYAEAGWHNLEKKFPQNIKDLIATGMLILRDDNSYYDRFRDRVIFPIHDRNGRIIGFGGRVLQAEQQPKYLNSPETAIFQKNRELYGLHQIISQKKAITEILVVEGYMDVIALAQQGFDNAVATLGTATSAYHIQLLSRHTKKIIFAFDGDSAGQKAAWRALESALPSLNDGLDARFIFLPQGHDPDSLIRSESALQFKNRLENATSLNKFFFNTLMASLDTTSLAGKSQLVNKAKPYITKMSEGPYKQLIVDELARITHLDIDRIQQLTTSEEASPPMHSKETITRTPTRIAIAILLQNPEILAQCVPQLDLKVVDTLQEPVIKELIQLISKAPETNTAILIEFWRTKPEFTGLTKLAAWDHQVPESALCNEFTDTIHFLAKQQQQTFVSKLIKKSRDEGLSTTERQQLQAILQQRHQPTEEG